MTKVITYGTYDLLHYGHIRLLERAKELGDYLIVGVTADDFDKTRGKINVKQSLMERVEAVKATGIADEIIIEEYEGQKIDDIKRYNVDVFTVGSDWKGHFDYLNEYCNVVYLDRTQGVSSSEIRTKDRALRIGLVGEAKYLVKFKRECKFVNGINVVGICTDKNEKTPKVFDDLEIITNEYDELIYKVDAVYIISHPAKHYEQIKRALSCGKHVLCESPIALSADKSEELFALSKEMGCILMESIKTAYSTAFYRLVLLAKSGCIGDVVAVDSACTSLKYIETDDEKYFEKNWNSICAWGPTAMLPVFQLLGTSYEKSRIVSGVAKKNSKFDLFTKIDFVYDSAVASIKVGKGVKSEGELIVSGTKGYIYVPAPWWKTDYFEIRFENPKDNKRYFYQLDGEGIRYEIVAFLKMIETGKDYSYISQNISINICRVIEDFYKGKIKLINLK